MQSADLFDKFKQDLLNIDPVSFAEKYFTLDGEPFRLHGNGYKPFADIYRYIGVKSLEKNAKPIVLVKGRQVGATTMATFIELYFMICGLFGNGKKPAIRLMHCFPTLVHVFQYAKTKLNTAISSAKQIQDPTKSNRSKSIVELKLDKSQSANESLQFKQFVGGNFLRVESTGLKGDRLRGGTIDIIFYDEVQDIRTEAILNANKQLSQAKYGPTSEGVQVYFGTPKQKGSDYWKRWNDSNQQYYYLGCEKCEQHFPLYTPGSDEWEKIWLHGYIVKCTHCGHEQDKRDAAERGKWVPLNDKKDCKFIGYHINQLYMPNFTKERVLSEKPDANPFNSERVYRNEVLGEFYSGDAAPITEDEIYEKCADFKRSYTAKIAPTKTKKVYAGFDWGKKVYIDDNDPDEETKKSGQSYSATVVLTADGPNLLSIQFATLLKKNDMEEKKNIVEKMFRQYSISLAVGDIGYANDLTETLQKQYGPQFLASEAKDKLKGHAKFITDEFPNVIRFERNYYIAELFDLMKKGGIRFPYGNYEQVAWLVKHCCSMELKVTTDRNGEPIVRYIKGSDPNDGFMALLNAYLAYKFDITNGFTIQNPNEVRDPNKPVGIPLLLGYIPGM